ncbi:MAG: DinB family protein [Gemmatimonadota bacterium]|nr:DinB family protein [Gemmatimonadota bacterium]
MPPARWAHARRLLLAVLSVLLVTPAVVEAQMGRGPGGQRGAPAMDAARQQYEAVRDYVLQTARGLPEDLVTYRPTEEVRSFGELLGHIANASYSFCSAAVGEQSPNSTDYEAVTDKAGLTQALEEAFSYCDRVHGELRGPRAMEEVELFGQTGTRLWVLTFNATHTWEHYGNLVTYLRLNGIVPPSSGGMSGD